MRGRGYLEDTGVGGKTMLKWNFKKWYEGSGVESSGSE
jgi:hypothetical protein